MSSEGQVALCLMTIDGYDEKYKFDRETIENNFMQWPLKKMFASAESDEASPDSGSEGSAIDATLKKAVPNFQAVIPYRNFKLVEPEMPVGSQRNNFFSDFLKVID